jgi:carboxypeptidase Q
MNPIRSLAAAFFIPALLAQDPAPAGARAAGQDALVEAILDEGLNRSQVMAHLDHLTNRIGPRLTSSDRLTAACEWAAERLRGYGFDARLEEWGTFPVGFNRGPWFARMVAPERMELTVVTNAWMPGTTGKQRGVARAAPRRAEELLDPAPFRGAWVVAPAPDKDEAPPEIKRSRRRFYEEAGVLGVITSSGSHLVRVSGHHLIDFDALPTLVEVHVVEEHYQAIARHLEAGTQVELELDIRNHFRKGPIPLYNVIADLPGTEKPDEYVIFGGHIDSWDGATGTTDNGTGVSTALEAARILAAVGARGKRTIRVMLWSGEEQGLLGSAAWVRANQDVLPRISAVFVHDGGTNFISGIGGTAAMEADLRAIFAPVVGRFEEFPFEVTVVEGLRGGGSDHGSFLAFGVPGFFWNQSGRVQYGYGWHTQNDTYDIAVPEYQRHSATRIAIGALGTANLDHLLSRENLRSAGDVVLGRRRLGASFVADSLAVEGVSEGSPAEKAGLRAGDVLLEVDGVKVESRFSLREVLRQGGARKSLVIRRGDETLALTAEFER